MRGAACKYLREDKRSICKGPVVAAGPGSSRNSEEMSLEGRGKRSKRKSEKSLPIHLSHHEWKDALGPGPPDSVPRLLTHNVQDPNSSKVTQGRRKAGGTTH